MFHSVLIKSTCTVIKLRQKTCPLLPQIIILCHQHHCTCHRFDAQVCLQGKVLSVSNQSNLQLKNLQAELINKRHAAATVQVKVLSVSVLVAC